MKHTVAVTGGTGKVGLHIVQCLLKAGYHVHVLARRHLPVHALVGGERLTSTVMDLATLPQREVLDWLSEVHPLALIHAAGLTTVPGCELQPALATLMNTSTARLLARACAVQRVHCVLLSTEYVFDGELAPGLRYAEGDRLNPLNHYGETKALAELAVREECGGRAPWTICRTSVVYGTTQSERPDFVQWVRAVVAGREEVRAAVDQVNSPTYVVDLAQMLLGVIEQRLQGIYHVAGSTALSRYHFALRIAARYGLDETLVRPIVSGEMMEAVSPRRPLNAGLGVEKITAALGMVPLSLSEGLDLLRFSEARQVNPLAALYH